MNPSKRAGASRVQVATTAVLVALVLLGAAYVLTSPQSRATSTSIQSSTTSPTQSSTSAGSTTAMTSSSTTSSQQSSSATSASSSYHSSSSSVSSSSASSGIAHVIVVLMENEGYASVIGNPSAPFQNSLVSRYALAADYFGVAHPSLPNYLALVAGSTFGITSDCQPAQCSLPSNVTTIATLFDSHHLSWKEYAESMPTNCSQAISPDNLYYPKHDPFVYFGSITGNNGTGSTSSYCDSHVVSIGQFYADLQAGDLPNYAFITPNICDDAHSCPLSMGDQWLSTLVPKITASSSFASTALFIVYDEGSTNDTAGGGGRVPCIVVSPFAKPGYVSNVEYSHYSLLATVEAIFNLGSLGRNDATSGAMSDLFSPSAQIP